MPTSLALWLPLSSMLSAFVFCWTLCRAAARTDGATLHEREHASAILPLVLQQDAGERHAAQP